MDNYFKTLKYARKFIDELENSLYEKGLKGKEWKSRAMSVRLFTRLHREKWEHLHNIIDLSEFFGIRVLDKNKKGFEAWLSYIEDIPESDTWKMVKKRFDNLKHVFYWARKELTEKISLLDTEERDRLNEAFNCYVQELNYASIVLSVSAIESRLFSLMMLKQPTAKLEKLTLGELIREYLENKINYGNVIPDKHLPLLQYCNTYRVFSVHPKKEKINRANATAILCMTCSFLFDEKLKTKTEK
jgi:hypothetical protein